MASSKQRARPGRGSGLEVTDALNDVDASTIADRGDGVVVDLAVERRRRRRGRRRGPNPAWFCPQRYGAFSSAAIAELSERLGSLDAAFQHLAQQRAAEQPRADARRATVVAAINRAVVASRAGRQPPRLVRRSGRGARSGGRRRLAGA